MTDRYYVYIVKLLDKDDRLTHYTGMTNNPQRRFKQHQGLLPGGAKYCLQRKWLEMFVLLAFNSKHSAMKYEKLLKKQSWGSKRGLCDFSLFSIKGGE